MADTVVVPTINGKMYINTDVLFKQAIDFTRHHEVSPNEETDFDGSALHVERQEAIELTKEAMELISGATRDSTKAKYNCIIRKWTRYCQRFGYSLFATTNNYANFIAAEFRERNLKWSYLKSYASALKNYTKNVNTDLLKQLLKGVYNARPPVPKYCVVWDVKVVLDFLSAMRTDTLMLLSQKVTTLLMILSGNRVNMLTHMKLTNLIVNMDMGECTFTFDEVLKHSRPGIRQIL